MAEALRVAVRVRPYIHDYEKVDGIRNIIRMDGNQTIITNPETNTEKAFTFDFSYDSFADSSDPNHASQDTVWKDLGEDVLENAWKGFNVSLFAYGQTGSGKSHSMMGYPGAEGIVPRACREIFERIRLSPLDNVTFKIEASMLEIYNEKVRDLFNPSSGSLKVRDHPKTGPYVQNLHKMAVSDYSAMSDAMDAGTRARTVAATAMNATSSRAHTIFQIVLTQTTVDKDAGRATDRVATISLIDLAGSERADRTGASGDRLKEGCAINQSLSALGNVIFALADQATGKGKSVVPFRDSVLTHLLKNSLGGNAKTVMIAAISPSDVNYDETMSTLRYADRAKQIKTKAVVNEDPNTTVIRGLKEEIEELRNLLASQANSSKDVQRIKDDMQENERLVRESEMTWEQRLVASQAHAKSQDTSKANLKVPHILNLNQDMQLSGVLAYGLEEGTNRIGRKDASLPQQIQLSGLNILKQHCVLFLVGSNASIDVVDAGAKVFVNGKLVEEEMTLKHGDRIIFGNNHVFLFIVPDHEECKTTWETAINEVNEARISNLTEGERKARLEAEKEAKEMQNKIKKLEETMRLEREKAEEKAQMATEKEKEKLLEKQQELERVLKEQIATTSKEQQRKQSKQKRQAMLEEMIMQTIPMVEEANAIAEELSKSMRFDMELVASLDSNSDSDSIMLDTQLWIKVTNPLMMWEREKFVNRLYLMREMYEDFVESDRDLGKLDEIYGDEYDPFYDPTEELLIGKAYVMLTPLMFFINIEDSPPIIHYQGKTDGSLEVMVSLDDEQIARFDDIDAEEETTLRDIVGQNLNLKVTVTGAKGIPKALCRNVDVSYHFFNSSFRTSVSAKESINPRLHHVNSFSIPVTPDLLDYIEKQPLEFRVWGQGKLEKQTGSEEKSTLEDTTIQTGKKDCIPIQAKTKSATIEEKALDIEEEKTVEIKEEISKEQAVDESAEQQKAIEEQSKIESEKRVEQQKAIEEQSKMESEQRIEDQKVIEELSQSKMESEKRIEQLQTQMSEMNAELARKVNYIEDIEAKNKLLQGTIEMSKNQTSSTCTIN